MDSERRGPVLLKPQTTIGGTGVDYTLRFSDLDKHGFDWFAKGLTEIRAELVKRVVDDVMPRIREQIAEQLTADEIAGLVKEGVVQAVADMVKREGAPGRRAFQRSDFGE
jgi:hypothetical protein